MMTDNDIKSIALFFFYSFLDDRRAIEAASEAVELCRRRINRNPDLKANVAIVAITKQVWEKYSGRFVRGRPNYSLEAGWLVPQGLELGPWKEFQKSAQEDELLCLIWSKVLKIPDEEISLGLGVSVGTLRYRLGRALRKLGTLANPVSQKPLGVVR